jgi:hypothetical protein
MRNLRNGENIGFRTLTDAWPRRVRQDVDMAISIITTTVVTAEPLSDAIERPGHQPADIFESSLRDTPMWQAGARVELELHNHCSPRGPGLRSPRTDEPVR